MELHARRPSIVSGLVLFAAVASAARAASAPAAVDFKLKGLSGGTVKLADYRGKVVLLLFLSDDCGVCHEELPQVERIWKSYAAHGFVAIGIVNHEPAPESSLRQATFPLVLADGEVEKAYRVPGHPLHYLIGQDFTIQAKHRGYGEGRDRILEAEVRQLLAGETLNEDGQDLYGAQGSWEGHWMPGHDRRLRTDQLLPYLNDPDPEVQREAIEELGRRGAKDAVGMLGGIVASSAKPLPLRRQALQAMVRIGGAEGAGSFLRVAKDRAEPALLREEAVFALAGVIGEARVTEELMALLRDAEANVRLAAASVIGSRCVRSGKAAIEAALKAERNDWVKQAMTQALASLAACPAP